MTKLAKTIGFIFLLLQVGHVLYSQFIPERYFCWAPYDQHSYYEISVDINGNQLSEDEIEKRYRYKPKGWEPRAVANVLDIITQYERTYGKQDKAKVIVQYSINGHPKKTWTLNQ